MKQDSSITRNMTQAQEQHAATQGNTLREMPKPYGRALAPRVGSQAWADERASTNALHVQRNVQGESLAIASKTLYRIYTQNLPNVDVELYVKRYFQGATIYYGIGLDGRTQLDRESSVIIEIVSSLPDSIQRVVDLAGDLRIVGKQVSVLVTKQDVQTIEVTANVL